MVIDDHTGDWPHQRFSVAGEEEVEVDCIIGASASERKWPSHGSEHGCRASARLWEALLCAAGAFFLC